MRRRVPVLSRQATSRIGEIWITLRAEHPGFFYYRNDNELILKFGVRAWIKYKYRPYFCAVFHIGRNGEKLIFSKKNGRKTCIKCFEFSAGQFLLKFQIK